MPNCVEQVGSPTQGVVTFIRPVEPSVTGVKIFDGQKFYFDRLIALRKGP